MRDFFSFQRKLMLGQSLPHWLITPGLVLLRNHVRNKSDLLYYEVNLLRNNHNFAHVRFSDSLESTVSTKDLALLPPTEALAQDINPVPLPPTESSAEEAHVFQKKILRSR